MRLGSLGFSLALLGASSVVLAQGAGPAPAAEPAPDAGAQVIAPEAPPPAPEPPQTPAPESAPAPEKTPETAPTVDSAAPPAAPVGPAQEIAPAGAATPPPAPWQRAHWPLTLEGRVGLLLRPESAGGFDQESHTGAEVGLSLYLELKREFAVGLELDRASLGRGTAMTGFDTVSIDYSVASAMLGARAYPWRSEMVDLFVGLQLGVGIQGVSAQGTANNGPLIPATPYTCSGSDAPALQLGGGVGARLMLTPRWGVTTRLNAVGRRTSSESIEGCAQGIGTATTITGSLGIGYDFDLAP